MLCTCMLRAKNDKNLLYPPSATSSPIYMSGSPTLQKENFAAMLCVLNRDVLLLQLGVGRLLARLEAPSTRYTVYRKCVPKSARSDESLYEGVISGPPAFGMEPLKTLGQTAVM